MSVEEFTTQLKERLAQMAANRADDAKQIAFDLKAAIQLRIQTEGINYGEVKFSPYTPQHTKTRQDKGYQTEYVDFTMTGELWNDIQPRVTAETETSTTVTITANRSLNQNKLRGFVNKRGNILLPTEREIQLLNILNQRRINKYINF